MKNLDDMCHGNFTYTEKCAFFLNILSKLKVKPKKTSESDKISVFIEKNILSAITLETLSEEFHFSKNHMINIFKKEYKTTPLKYANHLRIKLAERLLETTSESAEQIAQKSGFLNYSHFYKMFLKQNGISPAKWRNNKRMNPKI